MAMYFVETNHGTELVPEDICGRLDVDMANASEAELADAARVLLPYIEGSTVTGIERREGWYGRLSAPGYLDCTSWIGPYATEQECMTAVCDEWEVDANGNELE